MQRLTDREEGQGEDRLEGLPGSKMDSFSKYLFTEHFLVLGDVTEFYSKRKLTGRMQELGGAREP